MCSVRHVKPRLVLATYTMDMYVKTTSAVTSLLVSLFLATSGNILSHIGSAFAVTAAFLSYPMIKGLYYERIVKRALRELDKLIQYVYRDEIVFSRPVTARFILYEAEGPLTHHYRISSGEDTGRGKGTVRLVLGSDFTCSDSFSLRGADYGVAYSRLGLGILYLPGLELHESNLKDIVLLYVSAKQPVMKKSDIVLASPDGCRVHVYLYDCAGICGEALLLGCSRARLYLAVKYNKYYIKVKLADLIEGEKKTFQLQLAPEEPIIVVAHRKQLELPITIAYAITKKTTLMGNKLQYILLAEFSRRSKVEANIEVTGAVWR